MTGTSIARIFNAIYERRWPFVIFTDDGGEILRPINTFFGKLAMFIRNHVDSICLFSTMFLILILDKTSSRFAEEKTPELFWTAMIWVLIYFMYFVAPVFLILGLIACLPCILLILQRFFNLNILEQAGNQRAAPATQEILEKVWKVSYISDESYKYVNPDKREQSIVIEKEDTKCSICLGWYENQDELRILPCSHHFHLGCADEWFKITATCPLCVRPINSPAPPPPSAQQQQQQPQTMASSNPDSNV